jgi:hypothetical protein
LTLKLSRVSHLEFTSPQSKPRSKLRSKEIGRKPVKNDLSLLPLQMVSMKAICFSPAITSTTLVARVQEGMFVAFQLDLWYFERRSLTDLKRLISIMLSRFRMSVNDCIAEYKALGGKVFANPRPISKGGILWHKYNSDRLRSAIEDVTNRHCFRRARCFGIKFPSDPDLCRT